jgi:hypothetical protein
MMRFNTLREVADAYKSGELTDEDILRLDNDRTGLYTGAGKVFDMHPSELLEEALDLLGVRYDYV